MTVQEMADRVAALMGRRLGLRGRDLRAKLRWSRGTMPAHVRRQALWLAQSARQARDPRLRRQVDPARATQAYAQCMTWLRTVDPRRRRWHWWLDWAASLAFQFLLLAALVLTILVWRGLV